MALAVTVNIGFIDGKGDTSTTSVRVPTGFTLANYVEFAEDLAQLVSNIASSAITSVSLSFYVDLSALGLDTVASSVTSVAKKLFLQFSTAVTGFVAKTFIPGLRETQVGTGSDDVNQADVDVAPLLSAIEDGIVVTGGTMTFTNEREHDITATQLAKERFRRRRAAG